MRRPSGTASSATFHTTALPSTENRFSSSDAAIHVHAMSAAVSAEKSTRRATSTPPAASARAPAATRSQGPALIDGRDSKTVASTVDTTAASPAATPPPERAAGVSRCGYPYRAGAARSGRQRDDRAQRRALARRARHEQRTAERLDPVGETADAGAARRVDAADAVVAHL